MAEHLHVRPPPAVLVGSLILFAVCMVSVSLWFGWALFAPREPGGMLCADASPLRSMWATVRGKTETGCAGRDKPIEEDELFGMYEGARRAK
jgi:hypothetical protein